MPPEITYLVSNYNKGPYIADCLASLHAQTSAAWRCLICDDKSTDDSLLRIQPWLSDKIKLLQNDQNQGVIYTLGRLIAAAPTEIVGVLDADDALYPEATALLLNAYAQHPTVGFVYSNFTNYSADLRIPLGTGWGASLPTGGTTLAHDRVSAIRTFRVSVYQCTEGIANAPLYAEDRDLVYKMEEVAPLLCVARELYKYRILPHSQSHDPQRREIAQHSHRRAYLNALDRRKIGGLRRLGYLLYSTNYYWMGQNHAPLRKLLARHSWRFTIRLIPLVGCR